MLFRTKLHLVLHSHWQNMRFFIVKQCELLELLLKVLVSDHFGCPDEEETSGSCVLILYRRV